MAIIDDEEGERPEGWPRVYRRRWSDEEKLKILAEAGAPGASVAGVARRHDVNANQVYTWRRQFRDAACDGEAASGFVPVVVSPAEALSGEALTGVVERPAEPEPVIAAPSAPTGRMEIVLGGGERIIVDRSVSAAALARVLGVLGRR